MLSLQKNEHDKPICIIKKNDEEISEVYLHEKKNETIDGFSEMDLQDGYQFQPVPNQSKERDVLFIAGKSGSGKSFYGREYLKQYAKIYPKRPIYLISYLDKDDTLDEFKKIVRINIYDPEFMKEELGIDDFKDACVIMDDIDSVKDKKLKMYLLNLLSKLLTMGRHSATTVLYCSHQPYEGMKTQDILNECDSLTIFPRTLGKRKVRYLLEGYFGMENDEIQKLAGLESRWVTFYKSCYPNLIMSQNKIYTL
jgi:hypothetical protein